MSLLRLCSALALHALRAPCLQDLAILMWQDVAEAIASWVCGRLGDYVRHFPDGEASGPLEAYVQLLTTLHNATGHERDLPEV